jgi:hypothetical protein
MKPLIRSMVHLLVLITDVLYRSRPYPRFYILETVARVPYFAYLSVLHLYETLGWWRKADLLKVHFAETWNELHHLLIIPGWRSRLGRSISSAAPGSCLLLDSDTALYAPSPIRLLFDGTD